MSTPSRKDHTLKNIITATLASTFAATFAFLGLTTAAPARDLAISVYGANQDAYRRLLYAPFEAKCGCKLVVEAGNSNERLAKLEARKSAPVIDLAVIPDYSAVYAAGKDLIDPIDVSQLSNYTKLYEFARDPIGNHYGVGYTFYATGIVYRTDKISISSWKDLWGPRLKDKLALPDISSSQGPMLLMMADRAFGGSDPAFTTGMDKIAEVKGGVVSFYSAGTELVQLFQQDEIWAAVTGRFNWPLVKRLKLPLAWASPSEGDSGGMNVMVLTKGSKNRDLALQFMDFWLSTEVQEKLAAERVDSPANAAVQVAPDAAENLTYGEDNVRRIHLVRPEIIDQQRAGWVNTWNEKIKP
jgi:putative spermidine/putrescine transport system substrate-binding protein